MIEFLDMPEMRHLFDLNLRKNKITLINKFANFLALTKLNLAQNQIKSISNIENCLPALKELVLDLNPIASSITFNQNLTKVFPSLIYYNQQRIREESRDSIIGSQDSKFNRKNKSSSEPPACRSSTAQIIE
jgi:hypothetical protein